MSECKLYENKYIPMYLNLLMLECRQSIYTHLITQHDLPQPIVNKLNPETCFILHDLLEIKEHDEEIISLCDIQYPFFKQVEDTLGSLPLEDIKKFYDYNKGVYEEVKNA